MHRSCGGLRLRDLALSRSHGRRSVCRARQVGCPECVPRLPAPHATPRRAFWADARATTAVDFWASSAPAPPPTHRGTAHRHEDNTPGAGPASMITASTPMPCSPRRAHVRKCGEDVDVKGETANEGEGVEEDTRGRATLSPPGADDSRDTLHQGRPRGRPAARCGPNLRRSRATRAPRVWATVIRLSVACAPHGAHDFCNPHGADPTPRPGDAASGDSCTSAALLPRDGAGRKAVERAHVICTSKQGEGNGPYNGWAWVNARGQLYRGSS